MGDRLIFQLGTNNWQRGGEFAPGSGILHEAHHHAYNALPQTASANVNCRIVPGETPNKFSTGPDGYEGVHIHAGVRFVTEWLE